MLWHIFSLDIDDSGYYVPDNRQHKENDPIIYEVQNCNLVPCVRQFYPHLKQRLLPTEVYTQTRQRPCIQSNLPVIGHFLNAIGY